MHTCLRRMLLLLLAVLLAACSTHGSKNAGPQGRVILWHAWRGAEAEALNALLAKFGDVYPHVSVITVPFDPDALKGDYADKVVQGLGPDLLLGSQLWTPELADADLIREVKPEDYDPASYLTAALSTLQYENKLYGLPLSVQTSALYYNRNLTSDPPGTLDALLEQAAAGKKVAISTTFEGAFWGVQAFGGQLVDETGRLALDQGGFANWLDWLANAQTLPNVILSDDAEILTHLFEEGRVAYYVGWSTELLELQEALGTDTVGVAPLPAGPNAAAGPLLMTEPLFFSTASSPAQAKLALLLARFLTNTGQQRKLAQQIGRVPANPQVRIDRRVTPAVAGFVEQSKTAVPLLLLPQMFDAIKHGHEAYVQVLEGLADAIEAANQLTKQLNAKYGFEHAGMATQVACTDGQLELWHSWTGAKAAVLDEIQSNFRARCPSSGVTITRIEPNRLMARYQDAVRAGEGPDLLLTSNEVSTRLASAELVRDISDMMEPRFLQHYIPRVPDAMRYEGRLYGIPIAIDLMALYYNADLVTEPAVDMGDLVNQANADRQVALAYKPYENMHWGIRAFGGRLFDVDGNLALTEGGFAEWLSWLQRVQDQPGFILTRDPAEAQALFMAGEAAYFAGKPGVLDPLQTHLGKDQIRVVPLPSGPEGPSGPVLRVEGLMINPTINPIQAGLAVEFAKFMAGAESQTLLMDRANLIPANMSIADATAHSAIAGFFKQAKTAVTPPNRAETATIFGLGDIIFESVLENNEDPETVLQDFSTFLHKTYDTGEADNTSPACNEEANLLLWHSTQGVEAIALDHVIANFARRCPGVRVETVYVPADTLPNQLAAVSLDAIAQLNAAAETPENPDTTPGEGGNGPLPVQRAVPDLILASHDLIAPLSGDRLIKPIGPFIESSTLIPYYSQAIDAFTYNDALYGLPYSMDTVALFYNRALVPEPPASLSELLASDTITAPVALAANFHDAFWGVLAFGGQMFADENLGSSGSSFNLENTGLATWLSQLQQVQGQPGIVMSARLGELQDLFLDGKAGYLIAGPDTLASFRAQLAADAEAGSEENTTRLTNVGIIPLPPGPAGPARPFLTVNGFLFSSAVDEKQTAVAVKFAEFATSGESQALVMEQAERVPANALALIQVNDPEMSQFVEQTKTSALLPPRPQMRLLLKAGDALYADVLENHLDPAVAVEQFATYVGETPQPIIIAHIGDSILTCDQEAQLLLWHPWPFAAPDEQAPAPDGEVQAGRKNVLDQILADFTSFCPGVEVKAVYVPAQDLRSRLKAAISEDAAPDLFLAPHDLIAPLAADKLIKPITSFVSTTDLEAYLPKSVAAMQYEGELYGLPQAIDVMALYYNAELVSRPVHALEELISSWSPGTVVALDSSFYGAFWGVSAFGGRMIDAEGNLVMDEAGFVDWLAWLKAVHHHPGFLLSPDQDVLRQYFRDGKAAYLVAGPDALRPLRETLGERVRVTLLPAGPQGEAAPFVRVNALLFSAGKSDERTKLAIKFAQFITSKASETLLSRSATLVPTNRAAAETVQDAAMAGFVKQATETGILLPDVLKMAVLASGDEIYDAVMSGELDPAAAVSQLVVRTSVARAPEKQPRVPAKID